MSDTIKDPVADVKPNMIEHTGAPLTAATVWLNENFMKDLGLFYNKIIQHPTVTAHLTLCVLPDKKEGTESTVVNFDFQDGIVSYAVLKGATPDKSRKGMVLTGDPKQWAKVFSKGDLKSVKNEFDIHTFGMDCIPALHILLHAAMGIAKDYKFMSPKDIDKGVKSTK